MFGYVIINRESLADEAARRYESAYCGLCRTLGASYGPVGRMTLSYDMTFLSLLLASLYEPTETSGIKRCPPHPLQPRPCVQSAATAYAADMNIALFYHKCLDDWKDERKPARRLTAALLSGAYKRVKLRYPEKCRVIEESLAAISALEHSPVASVDALANETGRFLAEVYAYKADAFEPFLRAIGAALGRFIYLMDAYEDLPGDLAGKRFNPLSKFAGQEGYETLCHDALTMMIGECTDVFEKLPLAQDMDILRNILYSGVWTKYALLQKKKETATPHRPTRKEKQ